MLLPAHGIFPPRLSRCVPLHLIQSMIRSFHQALEDLELTAPMCNASTCCLVSAIFLLESSSYTERCVRSAISRIGAVRRLVSGEKVLHMECAIKFPCAINLSGLRLMVELNKFFRMVRPGSLIYKKSNKKSNGKVKVKKVKVEKGNPSNIDRHSKKVKNKSKQSQKKEYIYIYNKVKLSDLTMFDFDFWHRLLC